MSNKRKMQKRTAPRHQCVGDERVIHFCNADTCPGEDCPNTDTDLRLCCDKGYKDALAASHGSAIVDCPVCGGRDALDVTLGTYWLGEPEKVLRCLNGCDPSVIEKVLEEPPVEAYTRGCCPSCRLNGQEPHEEHEFAYQAPKAVDDKPTALYRWYDVANLLLYVGISDDLAVRVKGHVKGSSWMEFAARSTIERFPSRALALKAETEAIRTEGPLFNYQHNNSPEAQKRLVEYLIKHKRLDLLSPAVSRG